jgi:hypothetical protein
MPDVPNIGPSNLEPVACIAYFGRRLDGVENCIAAWQQVRYPLWPDVLAELVCGRIAGQVDFQKPNLVPTQVPNLQSDTCPAAGSRRNCNYESDRICFRQSRLKPACISSAELLTECLSTDEESATRQKRARPLRYSARFWRVKSSVVWNVVKECEQYEIRSS